MRKSITFLILWILILSGIGVGAFSLKKINTVSTKVDTYDMVIIAPTQFSEHLQPLLAHKNSYGVHTFLKKTEDIYQQYSGRDDAEKIKYFIKDAIESNQIQYVLLIGGRQGQRFTWYVPYRFSNVDDGYTHKQFLSDLYFADIYKENGDFETWDSNGNGKFAEWYVNDTASPDVMDLKPDVAVGRLPCRNEAEVVSIVRKIIEYENNTYGSPWFHNALLVGGDTNLGVGDPFPYEGEATCNYTQQYLDNFTITTLYTSDGTLKSSSDFISAFNAGNGVVLFHGHGLPNGIFTYTPEGDKLTVFVSKEISQLHNNGMYPIMVVGCCLTTEFDVGLLNFLTVVQNLRQYHRFINCKYECVPDVLGWNMVKKPEGGSIAHIGSSSTAWGEVGDKNLDDIPDCVQTGHTSGLCTEFFKTLSEGTSNILGNIYSETLTRIITNYNASTDRLQCKCVQEFQLLGDPSLKIGGYQ